MVLSRNFLVLANQKGNTTDNERNNGITGATEYAGHAGLERGFFRRRRLGLQQTVYISLSSGLYCNSP